MLVPFSLQLTPPVRLMLLAVGDDETYADLEVQWVRDRSGAEGLVLLAVHRDTGTSDVCVQAGLDIPRADYEIGTGLARFESVLFERARFDVTPRGAQVDLAVVLLDGRMLRLEVMESRRRPRPLVRMLAPAGQAMTDPHFFPFFWMDDIWFLRWRDAAVGVEVDGRARRVARIGMPWRLARYAVCPRTTSRVAPRTA